MGDLDVVTYIYRCTNRRCSSFKRKVESKEDPVAAQKKTGKLPSCLTCGQVLHLHSTIHPRIPRVFRRQVSDAELRKKIQEADDDVSTMLQNLADQAQQSRMPRRE